MRPGGRVPLGRTSRRPAQARVFCSAALRPLLPSLRRQRLPGYSVVLCTGMAPEPLPLWQWGGNGAAVQTRPFWSRSVSGMPLWMMGGLSARHAQRPAGCLPVVFYSLWVVPGVFHDDRPLMVQIYAGLPPPPSNQKGRKQYGPLPFFQSVCRPLRRVWEALRPGTRTRRAESCCTVPRGAAGLGFEPPFLPPTPSGTPKRWCCARSTPTPPPGPRPHASALVNGKWDCRWRGGGG